MRHPFCAVAFLTLSALCFAAPAGKLLLTKEPDGWKEVGADGPGGDQAAFPTRKFVPIDERNAALLVTLVGTLNGRVPNLPMLKRLHTAACQRFLSSPDQQFAIKELQLPNGAGYYSTFEDPALVGKPPVKDNFKFTSPCFLLFKTGEVVNATIFADEKEEKALPEAIAILQTLDVKAAPPVGPVPIAPQVPGPGGGWEAVSYVIKLPGNSVQSHLRACRVSGHTWIDLHLSRIGPEANHGLLREYLEKVVLLPKQE